MSWLYHSTYFPSFCTGWDYSLYHTHILTPSRTSIIVAYVQLYIP